MSCFYSDGCPPGVPTGTNTKGTSPQGHFCAPPVLSLLLLLLLLLCLLLLSLLSINIMVTLIAVIVIDIVVVIAP